MHIVFFLSAILAVTGTVASMALRNSIHCILSLTVGLVGIAGLYIALGAQFVGFTQAMVYVGAVAILAVFALMMTRSDAKAKIEIPHSAPLSGLMLSSLIFGVFAYAILHAHLTTQTNNDVPLASVKQIGLSLLHDFSVPLEITGILLTAALIGAVVVALPESGDKS